MNHARPFRPLFLMCLPLIMDPSFTLVRPDVSSPAGRLRGGRSGTTVSVSTKTPHFIMGSGTERELDDSAADPDFERRLRTELNQGTKV